jgi:hypothetical protein
MKNENISVESGGRHISYTGAPVNLASKVSDLECGAKRAIATDRVVSSVVEAANQEDLNCGRYISLICIYSSLICKCKYLTFVKCNISSLCQYHMVLFSIREMFLYRNF